MFIILQIPAISSWASPLACEDIFLQTPFETPLVSAKGTAVLEVLSSPKLVQPFVNANTKASWNSFETLEQVKILVEQYAAELKSMSAEQKNEERRQLLLYINLSPSLSALFDSIAKSKTKEYLPTEYDLQRKLVAKMIEIIKILPREFRPRVSKVSFDQRIKKLNKEAVEFMAEQERRFDKIFETTGFKDYAEYEKALRSSEDPIVKRALELIDQDKVEITIRRPENGRFWVPKVGFQNQYITKSSKGYYNNAGRNNSESTLTARTKEEYWPLDDELKPKYGSLRLAPETGIANYLDGARHYGDDLYILKKGRFQDRLSFYPGDTLSALVYRNPSWATSVQSPNSWQMMMIPWSRRLLMVPFMVAGLKENQFGIPDYQMQSLSLSWDTRRRDYYWESQIFGRLDLDMVETFVFLKTPPSGEFLSELKKRHIKIIDGRTSPAKEWVEETK